MIERSRKHSDSRYLTATLAVLAMLIALPLAATVGPDVTVITLGSTSNWGAVGGIRAYSVGTTSCNIGDQPVAWCDAASCLGGQLQRNDHPVIAQNLYRLKDGRFEQIGMSWLKHGWLSTNSSSGGACNGGACVIPPGGGDQLGVGCTDTYGSGLNGGSGNPGTCDGASGEGCRLGQRSVVNASNGDFAMPYPDISHPTVVHQRIQVNEDDVNPALNAGATYWVEGQYIAADDAAAANAHNNASYRRVTVGSSPFNLSLQDSTIREKSAIYAWKAADAGVELRNLDIETHGGSAERFEIARRITETSPGVWHHEYAVRNMNSDRSAQAFSIDFPDGTVINNAGFKDIDHHSGEPYATTDWAIDINASTSTITWFGDTFATSANANALRFATMFNFWFDTDQPARIDAHTLTYFKPGLPVAQTFVFDIFTDGFESGGFGRWTQAVSE
ncbi:MAG: hypothetical protein R2862_12135 [Thermoanaerobaculia bacterium]